MKLSKQILPLTVLFLLVFHQFSFSQSSHRILFNTLPFVDQISGTVINSYHSSTVLAGDGGIRRNNSGGSAGFDIRIPGEWVGTTSITLFFDFRKMENDATMIERGTDLRIWMQGGNLNVRYETEAGVVTGSNVYALAPSGSRIRYNIGFAYDETSGVGNLYVDDQIVWTNDGVNNNPLKFNTASEVRIGPQMDGSGVPNVGVLYKFESYPYAMGILPVELLYFKGLVKDHKNILEWATASEINFDYFTVERSVDLNTWKAIGDVQGAGNSTNIIKYHFEDLSAFEGSSYYRLKATDFDGSVEYHEVIRIESDQVNSRFSIYPNPGNGIFLTIEMGQAASMQQGKMEVLDTQGNKVYSHDISFNTRIEFDQKLKPGMYVVLVRTGQSTMKKKLQIN